MRIEEEIRKQLESDNLPTDGKDVELYKLLFSSLGKEKKSILSENFEDKVVAQLKSPLFTWREIAVFTLLALMPVIGLLYFADFATQVIQLPIISWITDHAAAIGFGVFMLLAIQLSDRFILRRISH